MENDVRFVRRLYTAAEAARFVGMHPSTFRTWAQGYERQLPAGSVVSKGPVIAALEPVSGDRRRVPFIGLVEAAVVQAFRQAGLSHRRTRLVLEVLAEQGELQHVLASRHLYIDGAEILYDYARRSHDKQFGLLTVVRRSGQRVFHKSIRHYLERITFGDMWGSELILPVTKRWLLRVLPDVQGGDPLFVNGGAPLSVVRSRLAAGEPVGSVAHDCGVPGDEIVEAVRAVWRFQAGAPSFGGEV